MSRAILLYWIVVSTIVIAALPACAQVGLEKYFTENFLPTIDNTKYQDVKFDWNIPGKTQTSMNEGLTAMDDGNFEAAILHFNTVLQHEPKFWPAYYYRGASRKARYDLDSALLDFQEVLKFRENLSQVHVAIGECYQQKFRLDKAKTSYERAIDIDPKSVLAHFSLGNIEFYNGNTRKAWKYFEACNELDAGYAPAYFMQAMLKVTETSKKNKESISYLDKALSVDSTYRQALFWRGFMYANQDRLDKCLQDWDRLVRFNPTMTFFLQLRGFLLIELGDFDRAFNDLRKAVLSRETNEDKFVGGQTVLDKEIDIHNAAAYAMRYSYGLDEQALSYFKKGFCYFLAGNRSKARYHFKRAAAVQPSATAYYLQALNYEHMSVHDTAFFYYDKALAHDNDIFDAHKKRGIYRFEVKDWKGAYQDFNEMVRLQPNATVTYRLRGYVKSHQEDFYGAIIDLTRFLKSDTTDANVYSARAFCRDMVNDKKGAVEDYVKSLSIKGNDDIANTVIHGYATLGDTVNALLAIEKYKRFNVKFHYDRIARIELLLELKYWKLAEREITQALTAASGPGQTSEAMLIRGLFHFHQDQFEPAISFFSQALRINAEYHEARYFRGKSYIALKKSDEALDDFKTLRNYNYADSKEILQGLKDAK